MAGASQGLRDPYFFSPCLTPANPPYIKKNCGKISPDIADALSRHELCLTFEELCRESSAVLKSEGRMYIVHRPFRLAELLKTMSARHLEPFRLRFVHSFADKEARLVLIGAKKGSPCDLNIEKPLIIYEKPGVYTPEVLEIYQNGAAGDN